MMDNVEDEGAYRRHEGVLARRIAGETVLVPIRGELANLQCIFALNPIGEHIWEQMDGTRGLQEVVDSVLAEFDVDASRAEQDAREFIAALRSEGLITTVADS